MKILIFSALYLPGFKGGGPIRTLANLVHSLGDEFEFYIVTSDRDLGSSTSYERTQLDQWIDVGLAKVLYASPQTLSISGIYRLIRGFDCDAIYLNSFFGRRFSILPFWIAKFALVRNVPVLIAPRGEFSSAALKIKCWRKSIFLYLLRVFRLHTNTYWQASSEFERLDIQRTGLASPSKIVVAPNIFIKTASQSRYSSEIKKLSLGSAPKFERVLKVCFLSRISPMKNLDYALRVLAIVKCRLEFHIFGPVESPEYWAECERLMTALPSNIVAEYRGSVASENVAETIAGYDLFFVPTRGENYGHVFIESLSVGVPILLSDQTPWRSLSEKGLGWDVPLDELGRFSEVIDAVSLLGEDERVGFSQRCIKFAASTSSDGVIVGKSRDMFLGLMKS